MIRIKKANQLPDLEASIRRAGHFHFIPGAGFDLYASTPARGHAKSFDQRFRRLHVIELRLNFDQMPEVLVRGISIERRLRLFQFSM